MLWSRNALYSVWLCAPMCTTEGMFSCRRNCFVISGIAHGWCWCTVAHKKLHTLTSTCSSKWQINAGSLMSLRLVELTILTHSMWNSFVITLKSNSRLRTKCIRHGGHGYGSTLHLDLTKAINSANSISVNSCPVFVILNSWHFGLYSSDSRLFQGIHRCKGVLEHIS